MTASKHPAIMQLLVLSLCATMSMAVPVAASGAAPQGAAPTAKVSAGGILGRAVMGPDGREIGRVVDVLVDAGSNPRAAVIDVGGFLGVGGRRVAVSWSDITFPPTGSTASLKLDLTLDQIRGAPAYADQTKPASVVEPPPALPPPALPPPALPPPALPAPAARINPAPTASH